MTILTNEDVFTQTYLSLKKVTSYIYNYCWSNFICSLAYYLFYI